MRVLQVVRHCEGGMKRHVETLLLNQPTLEQELIAPSTENLSDEVAVKTKRCQVF